jgi:small nuclear ribonucleoprotein (snRNP)-like protein
MKARRYFQVAAITFALIFANSAAVYCQSPQNSPASTPRIQAVKDYVQKIGQGKDVTVIMFSGVEYYGAISKIEEDGFEIAEVDLKQMVAISYADVMKVGRGYSEMNSSGKRQQFPSPQDGPASERQIQTVKDYVQKIGQGKNVTVILFSGVEYYGAISKMEEDGFEIAEVDLKQVVAISYADVYMMEKGYGELNSSTGTRRKGLSSRPFWIFMAVGVAATVGFAIWASKRLGNRRPTGQLPVPFPRIP